MPVRHFGKQFFHWFGQRFHLYKIPRRVKFIESESTLVDDRGQGPGGWGGEWGLSV